MTQEKPVYVTETADGFKVSGEGFTLYRRKQNLTERQIQGLRLCEEMTCVMLAAHAMRKTFG